MTKHNTTEPQRDHDPRDTSLPGEIRRRFGGSENLHEDALEFLYRRLRVVNVPSRDAALRQLQRKAREQYAAYADRRNAQLLAEGFSGAKIKAPAPPVGSVGPVELSALPPAQRSGETFSEYLSRISTVASPGFDMHVAKARPVVPRPCPGEISTHRQGSALYNLEDTVRTPQEQAERARAAAAARELSNAFEPVGPLSALSGHFKREDDRKALIWLVESIAAAARMLSPRQRRKLEKLSPDLAAEIRNAEDVSKAGLGGVNYGD